MAAHSFVVVVLIYMNFGEISWMYPSFMDLMIGSAESHEPCSGAKVLLNTIAHSFVQFREVGRHAEAALCASSGESSFMLSQGRVILESWGLVALRAGPQSLRRTHTGGRLPPPHVCSLLLVERSRFFSWGDVFSSDRKHMC